MGELFIFIILIAVGYTAGSTIERRHYTSIREREAATINLPVICDEECDPHRSVAEVRLVYGASAISVDYFKVVAGSLKNVFGGKVSAYETLVDRARRESILRMKAEAAGYDVIINARLETSSIGKEVGGRSSINSIECYSYGTAIRYVR